LGDHGKAPRRRAEERRRASPFTIDVLTCPRCGGVRRLIAMITQRSVIERS
jgi:hypothetical protein